MGGLLLQKINLYLHNLNILLGITENGYEIFTESAKGYSKPPYL